MRCSIKKLAGHRKTKYTNAFTIEEKIIYFVMNIKQVRPHNMTVYHHRPYRYTYTNRDNYEFYYQRAINPLKTNLSRALYLKWNG